MPRHTPAFAAAMLVALTLPITSAAQAQLPPSKYDKLQRTLEDKFAPKKSLPPPPSQQKSGDKKDDFIYVDPNKTKSPTGTQKRGDVTWSEAIYSLVSSTFGKKAADVPGSEVKGAFETAQAADTSRYYRYRDRKRGRASSGPSERSGRKVPVAKPNSFVIQLSPDATDADIEALLKKYSLTITKVIAPLGVITVETASGRGAQPGAAAEKAQDSKSQLQNVLEPPIIKELRAEKVVDGAFVNSTMETKQIPKGLGATINVDGDVFSWRWSAGKEADGNWGLKAMRMPAVWSIIERHRKLHPDEKRPKVAIIDSGFDENAMVPFASMQHVKPLTYHTSQCGTHHGMHVAGIIGARPSGDQPGINGIVPDARMDAIAVDNAIVGDSGHVGVDEGWQVQALLFDDVLAKTLDYVYANLVTPDNLKVINISLGYNFVAANLLGDENPEDVPGLALHITHQANLIRLMASRVQEHVLFVVAAGNDSEDRSTPIEAKWASPFAWAGTTDSATGESPPNIIVVEAVDRNGLRAEFSNLGGDVSAPGVDIMSTLAKDKPLWICNGTSQASPHVAALAALLFELAPDKKPAEIAEIIRKSATPPPDGAKQAPSIDALEAVATVAPEETRLLADLDGDGTVTSSDLAIFSRQLASLTSAATANAAFTEDLNGDGAIDDNECFFPLIDLNGSGFGSLAPSDARNLAGGTKTDLAAMEYLWSDNATPFSIAASYAGLSTPAEVQPISTAPAAPITQCRNLVQPAVANAGGAVVAGAAPAPSTGVPGSSLVTASNASASDEEAKATRTEVEKAVEELRKTHPNLRVTINPATGLPATVTGLSPQAAGGASLGSAEKREQTEEETKRAVEAYFGTGGLSSLYPSKNKSAKPQYVGRRKDPDLPNRYVAEVEQRVDGVPVFGSTAKLNVDSTLGVTKFSGTISNVAIDDTKPKIAEGEAVAAARAKLTDVLRSAPDASRAFPLAPDPSKAEVAKPNLVVFDPALIGKAKGGKTRLAWLVSIDSFRIFVDADTGEAFYYYRDQPSGMLRRVYDLAQTTTFPGTVGIDEEKRLRGEKLAPEALTAFRNAGLVRDYFFLTFGRDGYDDNDREGPLGGAVLDAYVRHGRTQNAYWCTSKSYDCPGANVMVYGPGYAGALDIVAHEMTHGIIAHEKNLLYLNEPGAVNESLADIFGALIEFDAKGDGGNWLIGEASPGFSVTAPLRSLADPNLKDANGVSMFNRAARFSLANRGQPDHYSEVLTPDDEQCGSTAYEDNGCVHFNSGILNKFAYLVSEGGTHHGVTVSGIGHYKLARITYRAMTVGLNQSSTLTHAANVFVESCFELASAELAGLIPADCDQVVGAQRAVGLEVPSS